MELRERRPDTLKEKLRAHYHNREFTPEKIPSNSIAMAFFMILTLVSLLESLLYLIPGVYPDRSQYWLVTAITAFLFLELSVNWHRSYWDVQNYVRGTTKEKYFQPQQETPADWKTCPKCQVDAPPRSHHCNHCGKCMLKRDHHCFFTGSCVGYYNQKFFVVFCLYTVLSTVFIMFLQLSYLHRDLPLLSWDMLTYLLPCTLYKWLAGYITFGQLFIIVHFYLLVFSFLISVFFLVWQILVITYGYTSYEAWKRISDFQGSTMRENITSVFGSLINIPILILVPYRFEQPGDGIQWTLRCKRVKGQ